MRRVSPRVAITIRVMERQGRQYLKSGAKQDLQVAELGPGIDTLIDDIPRGA